MTNALQEMSGNDSYKHRQKRLSTVSSNNYIILVIGYCGTLLLPFGRISETIIVYWGDISLVCIRKRSNHGDTCSQLQRPLFSILIFSAIRMKNVEHYANAIKEPFLAGFDVYPRMVTFLSSEHQHQLTWPVLLRRTRLSHVLSA